MAPRDRTGVRLAVLLAATLGATVASARLTAGLRHPSPSPRFDDLLLVAASWTLLLASAWSVLAALALALEAATSGHLRASWLCPAPMRRALLTALGIVLIGGAPGGPAGAVTARSGGAGAGPSTTPSTATLPLPSRPVGRVATTPGVRVVVRRGDTLWDLAADSLPRHAPPAVVAHLVERAHRANRAVIGDDPGHIEPGQRLVIPHQRVTTTEERTP